MRSDSKIVFLILSMAFLSCSVLEDREECPCRLVVFSDICESGETSLTMWDRSRIFFAESVVADATGKLCEWDVARGMNRLCAVYDSSMGNVGEESLKIPLGSECDSVYACTSMLDCRGDFLVDTLTLCKQFATLRIHFSDPDFVIENYRMVVISDVCGFTIPFLSPLAGSFEFEVELDSSNVGYCRLPRQTNDKMHILLLDRITGIAEYDYKVGEAISDIGYNWDEEQLKDMDVWLNYTSLYAAVTVEDWDEEDMGEVKF